MAMLLKSLYKGYFKYVVGSRDTRLDGYMFIGEPVKLIVVLAIYWLFVKEIGPKLMQNRKPYDLKYVLMVYNIFQIIINTMLALYATYTLFNKLNVNIACIEIDYSFTDKGFTEAKLTYAYFIIKLIDLLDTIFFILRKRYNQITFLHIYHHIAVCFGAYACVQYVPAGQSAILGIVNTYVHIIMYGYYYWTSQNPELKKNVWWKKYITQLQIAQFAILFISYSSPLLVKGCKFPKFWSALGIIQNLFMLVLFSNFYRNAYVKKKIY